MQGRRVQGVYGVRNARVEEHAGKRMLGGWWGRDCKGTGECKGMQGRGMQETQGVGGAGAQRHTWTEGWKAYDPHALGPP